MKIKKLDKKKIKKKGKNKCTKTGMGWRLSRIRLSIIRLSTIKGVNNYA